MGRYFCDYCDTYLTHDSPNVRKTHCSGRKHKDNVRIYYQSWLEEQSQKLIKNMGGGVGGGMPPPGFMRPPMPPHFPPPPGGAMPPQFRPRPPFYPGAPPTGGPRHMPYPQMMSGGRPPPVGMLPPLGMPPPMMRNGNSGFPQSHQHSSGGMGS